MCFEIFWLKYCSIIFIKVLSFLFNLHEFGFASQTLSILSFMSVEQNFTDVSLEKEVKLFEGKYTILLEIPSLNYNLTTSKEQEVVRMML